MDYDKFVQLTHSAQVRAGKRSYRSRIVRVITALPVDLEQIGEYQPRLRGRDE